MEDVSSRSTKSLTPKQNDMARKLVRDLLDTRFNGNQVTMAGATGLSQSTISDLLAGKGGVGVKMIEVLIKLDSVRALKIFGLQISDVQQLLGESSPEAIATLQREGYSADMASWAVMAAYRWGAPEEDVESVLAKARMAASMLRTLELSAQAPSPPRGKAPKRTK
jgi:Holliday junction resolvase